MLENIRALAEQARAVGVKTAVTLYAFAYDLNPDQRQQRALEAIQANWETYIEGRAVYDFRFLDAVREFCRQNNLPFLDLTEFMAKHPRRYELYLDLAHFNSDGMAVVAGFLYDPINDLGWWDEEIGIS